MHAVDSGFDDHEIPYDVIWLDIEHTNGKRWTEGGGGGGGTVYTDLIISRCIWSQEGAGVIYRSTPGRPQLSFHVSEQ